ncbi:MAG TPA: response regulator transcription factor, partial [Candidatus Mediterraneibacter merdigallinarum]|nr:response regulator transcription factor [Candidatus Mediterraneibacter merdigallinarum]
REELRLLLENGGYAPCVTTDFENAADEAAQLRPDLVLLDILLPDANGQSILRDIRSRSDVPVIMLTSRSTDADEIISRSSGADDYVTKPYNPALLLLRIETVLRRTGGRGSEEELTYRGMRLNLLRSSVTYKGAETVLSRNEMNILHCLLKKRGTIVSRDELMDYLWDRSDFVDDNTLTVNINRLRKRLEGLGFPDVIETRRKQGYMLV